MKDFNLPQDLGPNYRDAVLFGDALAGSQLKEGCRGRCSNPRRVLLSTMDVV